MDATKGRTYDVTHLPWSTFYNSLMAKEILQEHILQIRRKEVKPYILGNLVYPLHTQIQKHATL